MYDPKVVGFDQSVCDLHHHTHSLADAQLALPLDHALQVFPFYILHGDVGRAIRYTDVVHPADTFVSDLAGKFQLVPEPFQNSLIQSDFWP